MEHKKNLTYCQRHLGSHQFWEDDICLDYCFKLKVVMAVEFQTGIELSQSYLGLLNGFYASSDITSRVFFNVFFGNYSGMPNYLMLQNEYVFNFCLIVYYLTT